MSVYRFRILPEDGLGDIEFRFANDDTALQTAKVFVRELVRKEAARGLIVTKGIQVRRSDGALAGLASHKATPTVTRLAAAGNLMAGYTVTTPPSGKAA